MKILVVQDYLRSGGTERQSILLANHFAAAGHTTTLLTFRPGGALRDTLAPNVATRVLQPFDTRLDWFAPNLQSHSAQLQPDIVLCMGRMANCYAGALQRRHSKSTVVSTMRTGKKLPLLFRSSLRSVRHVVANSHDAAHTLQSRYGIDGAKISVIHNSLVFPPPVAAKTSRDEAAKLRTRFGANPRTTVLLCVAMLRPEKQQSELIEIVRELGPETDWQLWLAGDGPARRDCEILVARHQLSSRVKFLGYQRDPTPFYRAADVAVHASSSEALSNFLIEAQAHGLPAVAYAAQGIAECFLVDETGWVIARDDRAAFRATLLRLVNLTPAQREQLAVSAERQARQRFDPVRQVDAYLSLFETLHPPGTP